jgi:hypothetical protein
MGLGLLHLEVLDLSRLGHEAMDVVGWASHFAGMVIDLLRLEWLSPDNSTLSRVTTGVEDLASRLMEMELLFQVTVFVCMLGRAATGVEDLASHPNQTVLGPQPLVILGQSMLNRVSTDVED